MPLVLTVSTRWKLEAGSLVLSISQTARDLMYVHCPITDFLEAEFHLFVIGAGQLAFCDRSYRWRSGQAAVDMLVSSPDVTR